MKRRGLRGRVRTLSFVFGWQRADCIVWYDRVKIGWEPSKRPLGSQEQNRKRSCSWSGPPPSRLGWRVPSPCLLSTFFSFFSFSFFTFISLSKVLQVAESYTLLGLLRNVRFAYLLGRWNARQAREEGRIVCAGRTCPLNELSEGHGWSGTFEIYLKYISRRMVRSVSRIQYRRR